jgi:hypothetical protein
MKAHRSMNPADPYIILNAKDFVFNLAAVFKGADFAADRPMVNRPDGIESSTLCPDRIVGNAKEWRW